MPRKVIIATGAYREDDLTFYVSERLDSFEQAFSNKKFMDAFRKSDAYIFRLTEFEISDDNSTSEITDMYCLTNANLEKKAQHEADYKFHEKWHDDLQRMSMEDACEFLAKTQIDYEGDKAKYTVEELKDKLIEKSKKQLYFQTELSKYHFFQEFYFYFVLPNRRHENS